MSRTKKLSLEIVAIGFLLISISALQTGDVYADSNKHKHHHQYNHQYNHGQYDLTDKEELYPVTDVRVGD